MRLLLGCLLTLLLIGGCTSKPVQELDNQLVPSAVGGEPLSLTLVEQSILNASRKRGWIAKVVKPGLIEAQISVRNHGAVVQIPFTQDNYAIQYQSSNNLNFEDGNIHRNYNKWVANLAKSIRQELVTNAAR